MIEGSPRDRLSVLTLTPRIGEILSGPDEWHDLVSVSQKKIPVQVTTTGEISFKGYYQDFENLIDDLEILVIPFK